MKPTSQTKPIESTPISTIKANLRASYNRAVQATNDMKAASDKDKEFLTGEWKRECNSYRHLAGNHLPVLLESHDMLESVMRWVPTSERLPEPHKTVIVAHTEEGMCRRLNHVLRAFYIPPKWKETEGDYEGEDEVYDEEKDVYYWPDGWYECNLVEETHYRLSGTVVAWQDLPVFPEVTN